MNPQLPGSARSIAALYAYEVQVYEIEGRR